jgi:hypothetical protein
LNQPEAERLHKVWLWRERLVANHMRVEYTDLLLWLIDDYKRLDRELEACQTERNTST